MARAQQGLIPVRVPLYALRVQMETMLPNKGLMDAQLALAELMHQVKETLIVPCAHLGFIPFQARRYALHAALDSML